MPVVGSWLVWFHVGLADHYSWQPITHGVWSHSRPITSPFPFIPTVFAPHAHPLLLVLQPVPDTPPGLPGQLQPPAAHGLRDVPAHTLQREQLCRTAVQKE